MQKAAESGVAHLSRRAALKALGTGIGTVAALPWLSDEGLLAFARLQETNAPPQLKALSRSQFATLEVFVEAIIPTGSVFICSSNTTSKGHRKLFQLRVKMMTVAAMSGARASGRAIFQKIRK